MQNNYFIRLLLIFIILCQSIIMICADEVTSPISIEKKSVVIAPVYYINKSKENEYLAEIIRDVLKTKLISSGLFKIVIFSSIDEKIKKSLKNEDDYKNESKIIDLSKELKGDILIIIKYAVTNNKIMINLDVYQVDLNRNILSYNIYKDLGLQVFDIIDKVSVNINDKITIAYKNVEDEIKKVILQNEKLNKEKEEKEKYDSTVKKVVDELINTFFGLNFEVSYNSVYNYLTDRNIKIKIYNNQIITDTGLTNVDKVKNMVFNFYNGKLTDMSLLLNIDNELDENNQQIINRLKGILSSVTYEENQDKLVAKFSNYRFELAKIKLIDEYFYCLNFSCSNSDYTINDSIKNLQNIKPVTTVKTKQKNINFNFGLSFDYSPLNINYLFYENYYFNFSYNQNINPSLFFSVSKYVKDNYAIGAGIKTGYNLNMLIYSKPDFNDSEKESTVILFHELSNELFLANKIGNKNGLNYLLIDIGFYINIRFANNYKKYNDDYFFAFNFNDAEKKSNGSHLALQNIYPVFGPALFIGYERQSKNKLYVIAAGGFIKAVISELKSYGYYYDEFVKSFNSVIIGFNAGFEFRIGINQLR